MDESIEPLLDVNYAIDRAPDPSDQLERGFRALICGGIWQRVMDLTDAGPAERWSAQYYFHDRQEFDPSAEAVGLDPDAVREGLIKRGLLPAQVPPPPAGDD